MKKIYILLTIAVAMLFTGCSTIGNGDKGKYPKKQDSNSLAVFISDNQHLEDYGHGILAQGRAAASITTTARRSALNNLFGLDVIHLVESIERNKSGKRLPIIHLGDALNNSCSTEMDAFVSSMEKINQDWFIAPGNHDAYYLGISYPEKFLRGYDGKILSQRNGWGDLCRPWRETDRWTVPTTRDDMERFILDKRDFIKRYLAEKELISKGKKIKETGSIECSNGNSGNLNRICWDLSVEGEMDVWNNFVVQEILLGDAQNSKGIRIILVDTTAFTKHPQDFFSIETEPPLYGQIIPGQKRIIEDWLKENRSAGITTILAGHHPYSNLVKDAREIMNGWAEKGFFGTYASAHTHEGKNMPHKKFLEINIGSLIDDPVEYAVLEKLSNDSESQFDIRRVPLKSKDVCDPGLLKRHGSDESIYELAERLHKGSRKGKRRSLAQEAETYIALINLGVFKFKEKPTPVCYRQYTWKCDEKKEGEGECAGKNALENCGESDLNSFKNLKILRNEDDIKMRLINLIPKLKKHRGRYLYEIEGSRLLAAVREYFARNEKTEEGQRIKACLSIIGSEIKGKGVFFWGI
uniref:Calcineurin-like phosphoesterase n=1 Tax=Candidatus Kentrum eta TaxID=2126337 RepID=A0A450V6D2_9GAMM|nr:MAG: Calcineurin-like phosphoesterase [Candidatus Kentron sp. H]VFK00339.1 MAG: Calcineurin-like phosphoesterase [Candidatus Kentron sp. H]